MTQITTKGGGQNKAPNNKGGESKKDLPTQHKPKGYAADKSQNNNVTRVHTRTLCTHRVVCGVILVFPQLSMARLSLALSWSMDPEPRDSFEHVAMCVSPFPLQFAHMSREVKHTPRW